MRKIIKKIINYLMHPRKVLLFIIAKTSTLFSFLSDENFLKMRYWLVFSKKLDLENPQSFNEKLQWLKLYDRKEIYSSMVDKYEAKKYVSNIIGDKYIIPTYGIYNCFDEIDWDTLPEKFVIKCTHLGGGEGVVFCKDKRKFNINKNRKLFNKLLKKNLFWHGREWPYKNIVPRIIIEKYLENTSNDKKESLDDYKFFCFNGKVKYFKVDFNRFYDHQANYYDHNLVLQPFGEAALPPDFQHNILFPNNINKMMELAEEISKDFKFLRVDFYNVDGSIYFGEITFYPASGFGIIEPQRWDDILGKLIIVE